MWLTGSRAHYTAQHHKKQSDHISSAWEKIKIQSMVSPECILLLYHRLKVISWNMVSWGPSVQSHSEVLGVETSIWIGGGGTQFISWQEGEAEARVSWPLWVDIVLSMPVLSNTTYLLSLVAAVPGVSGHRAGMTELVLECLFWWDSGPFRVDTHPSPKGQVDPSQLQSYSLSTTWNKKKLSFLRNEMEFPRYLVLTL